jgi:hypothetical protein
VFVVFVPKQWRQPFFGQTRRPLGAIFHALAGRKVLVGGAFGDPTYRIGKLEAANRRVVAVSPNQTIKEAVTLMLVNGFSQLPIMQGDRDVKGIVSWESIGTRLSLGRSCGEVRDCMSTAQIIGSDTSLLAAIGIVAQYGYVLVRSPDRTISGIVTSSDLSLQFQQLTEPFLLLGEIEQHIRGLVGGKFTLEELKAARNPADANREVKSVANLTMGEYMRLLENPQRWEKLNLLIERTTFIDQFETVGRTRNEIMHFNPDPLGDDKLRNLRQFVVFLQCLRELGVVQ